LAILATAFDCEGAGRGVLVAATGTTIGPVRATDCAPQAVTLANPASAIDAYKILLRNIMTAPNLSSTRAEPLTGSDRVGSADFGP
jgi:hypothetical protein